MAHYTYQNTSKTSQQATGLIFIVMSQGAEAFTVAYLGMTITSIPWDDWNLTFLAYMFIAMILGRAASIFISSTFIYIIQ